MSDHLKARGIEANVNGLPSLNLDSMHGSSLSDDFKFKELFGDIIMVELIDENDQGEVLRGGVWLKMDVTKKMWRRGKVIKAGPKCVGVEEGDEVAYPSDRGIPMITIEPRGFAVMVDGEFLCSFDTEGEAEAAVTALEAMAMLNSDDSTAPESNGVIDAIDDTPTYQF